MLMPTGFGDPAAEYDRLINGVAMWDVAAERQVELRGPDAAKLAQALCPRDLTKCVRGQGKYVAICDHNGTLLNDPILLKLADDRYWLSIADSNILFWSRAIAEERGLNVDVSEPDVSPLAIQGPQAEEVVAALFGDWVRNLKYFWFGETDLQGIPVAVARSGWSKQGGFEIYLMDASRGTELWNLVKEAGQPWDIGPGNPNAAERVESGLLSWGTDTDDITNPYEVRMGRYIDLDVPDDTVGIQALRQIKQSGHKRHQLGIIMDDNPTTPETMIRWAELFQDGTRVGDLTMLVRSPRLEKIIGLCLISTSLAPGDRVTTMIGDKDFTGRLVKLPFL
jgi:aminomethyltransferase